MMILELQPAKEILINFSVEIQQKMTPTRKNICLI